MVRTGTLAFSLPKRVIDGKKNAQLVVSPLLRNETSRPPLSLWAIHSPLFYPTTYAKKAGRPVAPGLIPRAKGARSATAGPRPPACLPRTPGPQGGGGGELLAGCQPPVSCLERERERAAPFPFFLLLLLLLLVGRAEQRASGSLRRTSRLRLGCLLASYY
jgi:hypothetical protein